MDMFTKIECICCQRDLESNLRRFPPAMVISKTQSKWEETSKRSIMILFLATVMSRSSMKNWEGFAQTTLGSKKLPRIKPKISKELFRLFQARQPEMPLPIFNRPRIKLKIERFCETVKINWTIYARTMRMIWRVWTVMTFNCLWWEVSWSTLIWVLLSNQRPSARTKLSVTSPDQTYLRIDDSIDWSKLWTTWTKFECRLLSFNWTYTTVNFGFIFPI